MNKEKILVIAPHADDEVLGCGGILKKAADLGIDTVIIVATNAHKGAPEMYTAEAVESTRDEALAAHKVLGVNKTFFLDFPAPNLVNSEHYRISIELSRLINVIEPSMVFLPHPADLHTDHEIIYKTSLVALRPHVAPFVRGIYCYETLSESEWYPYQSSHGFKPNVFVDISKEIDFKCKAFECFQSQVKEFPHPRSEKAIRALGAYRGSTVNKFSVEAFELVRNNVPFGKLI